MRSGVGSGRPRSGEVGGSGSGFLGFARGVGPVVGDGPVHECGPRGLLGFALYIYLGLIYIYRICWLHF